MPLSRTLGGKGIFVFFCVVLVFPLLCFLRLHTFSLEGPDRDLAAPGTGDLARPWEE